MAKKKEKPVVDNETGSLKVKEKKEQQPINNETKGNVTKVKEKMKMKPVVQEETITKVDLNKPEKPEENEVKEDNTNDEGVVGVNEDANAPQEQKEVQSEVQAQETSVLEEVTEEVKAEEVAEVAEEAIKESMETGQPLPENVQKLVDFMEETGGDLNDYVKLNQDYSKLDDQDLLYEYYKNTKPHLNAEEINFLMEDSFSYDEDTDDDREIRRKKLALKEQVASAKSHLDGQKSKYYSEIKSGSKLTSEQQEAINFYNESQKTAEYEKSAKSNFLNRTNKFFGDKFKGFEYNVGDKNYRFNVNDVNKTKEAQSDITNFIGKFLDKKGQMADEAGYHKSLFTAMNSDAVAKHFYEQGMADALKQSESSAKNIDMAPRQELGKNPNQSGMTARVIGETSSDFKFKIKNKK
jgi:hypothetical protein